MTRITTKRLNDAIRAAKTIYVWNEGKGPLGGYDVVSRDEALAEFGDADPADLRILDLDCLRRSGRIYLGKR